MNEYRNYNLFALRGDNETSDAEICQTFDLPIELAGTPDINSAVLKKMERENVKHYIDNGMDESDAFKTARQKSDVVRAEINQLLNK
jgi:hypothetical protein